VKSIFIKHHTLPQHALPTPSTIATSLPMSLVRACAFVAFCGLALGLPSPLWEVPPDPPGIVKLFASPQQISGCPGYAASNVVKTDNSITADLALAGPACNAYSDDIQNLKLLVEYQTGESFGRNNVSFMRNQAGTDLA
jgi:hypothetical protein